MNIAVLLGGTSAERDVSLVTGLAIARALSQNGHQVLAIDCAYGDKEVDFLNEDEASIIKSTPSDFDSQQAELNRNIFRTITYLQEQQVEVVFNALHGGYGENGQLQTLLDLAGVPYTGSGALASALGMDKHLSKVMFQTVDVPTAPWLYWASRDLADMQEIEILGLPAVVKPNSQGSTVGLSIIHHRRDLEKAIETAFRYSPSVIVEQYIPGRELTVAILGDEALPVLEIIPESGFYDYEAKYQAGKTRYEVPANIPAFLAAQVRESALRAFEVLGCRGYARVDFRLQENGEYFCLEVNTLPGMTPTSLVPKAARAMGIEFPELVERIVSLAVN